jgi:transposase
VSKLQVIEDEEHERVLEKVAAVDVAKKDGMVCVRGPHASRLGGRQSTVWTVPATMDDVAGLGDQLAQAGVQKVTLESTCDYWRIWVRREAHCRIARSAGRNWRRCSWI